MTTPRRAGEPRCARYTYRLRVSSTARAALLADWGRCRWIWNECVAKSRQIHGHNRAHPDAKATCGPAQLDRMLTEARAMTPWLRDGASVPQHQTIRDFAKARAKALKDIKGKLPVRQRAGLPRYKKKHEAALTLNYTARGFRLKDGRLYLAGGIVLTVVWSRELPSAPSSVRVYRDSLGRWHASFVAAARVEPLSETGRVLGVDWGVKDTATTTSDAHDLPHAEHGRRAAQRLARYQRMMARRKPAKGQAARAVIGKRGGRPRSCTRRSRGSGRTPPANGPSASWPTTTPSLSRTFVQNSSPNPPWPAWPPMRRSAQRRRPWSRWVASTGGTFASSTPPTPRWTAHSAERDPSTHCLFRNAPTPTPAPRAGPCPPGQELRARDAGPGRSHPGWR